MADDSLKCPACGAGIAETDSECPDCGINLVAEEGAFDIVPCPSCGMSLRGRPRQCGNCGADFDEDGDLVIHRIDDHLAATERRLANCSCQNLATKRVGEIVLTTDALYWLEADISFFRLQLRSGLTATLIGAVLTAPLFLLASPIVVPIIKDWIWARSGRNLRTLVEGLSLKDAALRIPREQVARAAAGWGKKFRVHQKEGCEPACLAFATVTEDAGDRRVIANGINEWLSLGRLGAASRQEL